MATFGRYEILDKLGEGAMGVVYRARDTTLGRIVAFKMLSADLGGDDELHERFRREAQAVGRLSHPNIVTVYDLGEAEGRLYMAMELLEGDDLRALIDRQVEIPIADRVRILGQICDGLDYAHSRGVVHRDIKPANMMVTTSSQVKLLDFGLARVATRATITRQGVILGTPDYMSPEQAMGRPIDSRSDIFSSGAVFYEFLTFQKPFKGKTLHGVLYQIVSEEPDPILTLKPDTPARLAAVVHRMLRKDPSGRCSSMREVGGELRQIHDALRRSRSRSALPQAAPPLVGEDARGRIRDHLSKGRALLDGGRTENCVDEMVGALALDPDCDEAAEILWRSCKKQEGRSRRLPLDPVSEARVAGLLERAGVGRADSEVRQAFAELALIAPDDPRFIDLARSRIPRSR